VTLPEQVHADRSDNPCQNVCLLHCSAHNKCCCTSNSSLADTLLLYLWAGRNFSRVQHCIVVVHGAIQCQHGLGLQVLAQPWFAFVENAVYRRFGVTHFTHTEFVVSIQGTPWLRLTLFRLIWRTAYVCLTTCEYCWFMNAGVHDWLLAEKLCIFCMPGWSFRFDTTNSSLAQSVLK